MDLPFHLLYSERKDTLQTIGIIGMTDDIRYVSEKVVHCDGNGYGSELGHPREYLHLNKNNRIECPYCSRVFIYEKRDNDMGKLTASEGG